MREKSMWSCFCVHGIKQTETVYNKVESDAVKDKLRPKKEQKSCCENAQKMRGIFVKLVENFFEKFL